MPRFVTALHGAETGNQRPQDNSMGVCRGATCSKTICAWVGWTR